MTVRIKWGILGNATIARKCVIGAIQKSRNGMVHALATRSPADAAKVAAKNGIKKIYDGYDAVLADPAVDAVSESYASSLDAKGFVGRQACVV